MMPLADWPGAADGVEPGLLLVHVRGQGDVVDRPGAGDPGAGGRRRVVGVVAAADRSARLPRARPGCDEPERLLEERVGSPPGRRRRRARCRSPGARARPGSRDGARRAEHRRSATTASSSPSPSGSSKPSRPSARRVEMPSAASRASQKSSASSEATRNVIVCTIPAPARPRRAPGYSKNVMSAPGLPSSSA